MTKGACVKHHDLGEMKGPLMLFGGPYSNAQAMTALLDTAKEHRIAGASLICTGDTVAYGAAPVETVEMVRASGATVIAGNVEQQLAASEDSCGCGFEDGSTCDRLSQSWFSYADAAIGPQDRVWMADLPDVVSFQHAGARYAVIHGMARDVSGFLWETDSDAKFLEDWTVLESKVGKINHVISGHSGRAFMRHFNCGRWINAGVIGMPPHKGLPQTQYAILDAGDVSFFDLNYDYHGASRDMRDQGLPDGYAAALQTGYWPSEDVLPLELRVPSLAKG